MTFEQKLQEIAAMPTATLINRLENEYLFECEGGGIANCAEWVELKARLYRLGCFEADLELQRIKDATPSASLPTPSSSAR